MVCCESTHLRPTVSPVVAFLPQDNASTWISCGSWANNDHADLPVCATWRISARISVGNVRPDYFPGIPSHGLYGTEIHGAHGSFPDVSAEGSPRPAVKATILLTRGLLPHAEFPLPDFMQAIWSVLHGRAGRARRRSGQRC